MKKLLAALALLVVIAAVALFVFVENFDIDKYRAQIAGQLSEQTGRKIAFNGPIHMKLSPKGAAIDIQNAIIGNPPWASCPNMATIGHFDLGVSLPELLHNRLVITGLKISDADIELEAENGGRDNWDLNPAQGKSPAAVKTAGTRNAVAIHVDKLAITNSRVTYYNRDGVVSIYTLEHLTVDNAGGAALHLQANYNGIPITLDLQAGAKDLLAPKGAWPFSADATYANYKLSAEGEIDLDAKRANVSAYHILSGGSRLNGGFTADWGGAVPSLHGAVSSEGIVLADLALTTGTGNTASANRPAQKLRGRVFSDAPLGLDALKSVNASFHVAIGEMILPSGELDKVQATVKLDRGFLAVDPFTATLGKGAVNGKLKINGAASPYQASVELSASSVPLDQLLRLVSAPSFLSGPSNLEINFAASGNSLHAMAGNAFGIFGLVAARGEVSTDLAHDASSALMALFAPTGSNDLNCLTARFIVKNGVARDNGILVDTGAATISGKGAADLGQENLDILLRARAKAASFTGQILPAGYVSGRFTDPHFSVNPGEVVENVANFVLSNGPGEDVPQLLDAPPGENACLYTLQHPTPRTNGVTTPNFLDNATNTIQNLSGSLKSMFGH